jgi:hypothetical protein
MYKRAKTRVLDQLKMSSTLMVVFKSSLIDRPREQARSCHVPFKSRMKAMKDGPLTGPNGITL